MLNSNMARIKLYSNMAGNKAEMLGIKLYSNTTGNKAGKWPRIKLYSNTARNEAGVRII
jgi:hypothetical protein